jgi:hypothetical protein
LGLKHDKFEATSNILGRVLPAPTPFDPYRNPTPSELPLPGTSTPVNPLPSQVSFIQQPPGNNYPIHDIIDHYGICSDDMTMVYLSLDPYHAAFEETLNLQKFDPDRAPTAGLDLVLVDDRLFLHSISHSTPAACIPQWRSRLKHA